MLNIQVIKIKKMRKLLYLCVSILLLTSCSENYSNGERIGMITQFSESGLICKSWEGHLNLTQTGMNSSSLHPFDFSIDNDKESADLVATLDSAATLGWKVKLVYHQVFGWNWFQNRGETNYFINVCEVLDKSITKNSLIQSASSGKTDTIYVVIVDKNRLKD